MSSMAGSASFRRTRLIDWSSALDRPLAHSSPPAIQPMNKPGGIVERLEIILGRQILVRPEVEAVSQANFAGNPLEQLELIHRILAPPFFGLEWCKVDGGAQVLCVFANAFDILSAHVDGLVKYRDWIEGGDGGKGGLN